MARAADSQSSRGQPVAGTDQVIAMDLRPRTGRRRLSPAGCAFWLHLVECLPHASPWSQSRGCGPGPQPDGPGTGLWPHRWGPRGSRVPGPGQPWGVCGGGGGGGSRRAGALVPEARSSVASGTRGVLLTRGFWAEHWAPASHLELGALRPGRAWVSGSAPGSALWCSGCPGGTGLTSWPGRRGRGGHVAAAAPPGLAAPSGWPPADRARAQVGRGPPARGPGALTGRAAGHSPRPLEAVCVGP